MRFLKKPGVNFLKGTCAFLPPGFSKHVAPNLNFWDSLSASMKRTKRSRGDNDSGLTQEECVCVELRDIQVIIICATFI